MDDDGPTASIIFFLVLLLIDVFFYGFGAAISSLNEAEVERRAEEEKDKKSVRLRKIIGNPTEYVNTVQLITTLVNFIMGATYLGMLRRAVSEGLETLTVKQLKLNLFSTEVIIGVAAVVSTLLLLYITLTLGVLLPKKIGAESGKIAICLYWTGELFYQNPVTLYGACDGDDKGNFKAVRYQHKK